MSSSANRPSTSEHFELREVAEGVFAAVEIEGGAAHSNAGIIDLGDRTLIFDTFETPAAAADLRAAAAHLTGRPPSYVVNSHAHADHWLGNRVFADAAIISTGKTRREMRRFAESLRQLRDDPSVLDGILRTHEDQLAKESDARRRALIEVAITKWRHRAEMISALRPVFPHQSFRREITFHGSRRTAEALAFDDGHSDSDCCLVLPEDRVALAGDLVLCRHHPLLVHGNPRAWEAHLEEIGRWEVDTIVPGHGPVGGVADITAQRQYLTTLNERVADAVQAGEPVEVVYDQPLPEDFASWLNPWSTAGKTFWEANVRFLYERSQSEQAE